MRMTEPLPNCFSIWPSAASSAFPVLCGDPSLVCCVCPSTCAGPARRRCGDPTAGVYVPLRRCLSQHNAHVSVGCGPSAGGGSRGERLPSCPATARPGGAIRDPEQPPVRAKLTVPRAGTAEEEAGGAREEAVAGVLLTGRLGRRPAAGAAPLSGVGPAAVSGTGPSAAALYKDAVATTRSRRRVDYASNSTEAKQTLTEKLATPGRPLGARRYGWGRG